MAAPNEPVGPAEGDEPVGTTPPWPDLDRWTGPVVGAVLCGGRSSRFGSDKALAPFGSSTVGERVVAAMREAGIDPVVAIGGQVSDRLRVPTVPDLRPGDGPLGGLATALLWARRGWVLLVPCDVPLLTSTHIGLLLNAPDRPERVGGSPERPDHPGDDAAESMPVVATVDGRPQVSLAVWPAADGRRLLRLLDGGERRFRAALDGRPWRGVEVPPAAVADADTPEELAELEKGAD